MKLAFWLVTKEQFKNRQDTRAPLDKAFTQSRADPQKYGQRNRKREAEGCYLLPELKSLSIIENNVVFHRHCDNLISLRHKHALGETALTGLLLQLKGHRLGVYTSSCGNFPNFQDA